VLLVVHTKATARLVLPIFVTMVVAKQGTPQTVRVRALKMLYTQTGLVMAIVMMAHTSQQIMGTVDQQESQFS
jgi:TRAP-type C4-dicarboxylate transport system permease large subunit